MSRSRDPQSPASRPVPPGSDPMDRLAPASATPSKTPELDAARAGDASASSDGRRPVDTYRAMVDPEAATFETPDAIGMNVKADQAPPPPGKAADDPATREDTYRRMVDPEAATFETPDAIGLDVTADRVEPPAGKKPPAS